MPTEALHRDDAYLRSCDAQVIHVGDEGVELDRTVFYATSGGQAADHGVLRLADGSEIAVVDARKSRREGATPDDTLHVLDPASDWRARLPAGTAVTAQIDWTRRHRHMRFHTATHLLCAVVRELVDGCSITADYARLDFAMTAPLDKEAVQAGLDRLVAAARPVSCEWITDAEMAANPQLVKSMSVSPHTHVRNTAEIGSVRVVKIEKKSARTRRVVLEFG